MSRNIDGTMTISVFFILLTDVLFSWGQIIRSDCCKTEQTQFESDVLIKLREYELEMLALKEKSHETERLLDESLGKQTKLESKVQVLMDHLNETQNQPNDIAGM